MVLNDSRPIGMGGVGSIPLSEIKAYCDLYAVEDLEDVDRLVTMIKVLDSEYLKWMKAKREQAKSSKQQGRVAGPKLAPKRGRMRR